MDLKNYIRLIPDFPKPGILFKDITPLLANPEAFNFAIELMSENLKSNKPDAIAAIESRGFLFASPMALKLNLPLIPIRKPGKLPYKTFSVEYTLEYGSGKLEVHEDAIMTNMKIALVDDLLATGGTAYGAKELIIKSGASISSYNFLIELTKLNGHKLLENTNIQSLIKY